MTVAPIEEQADPFESRRVWEKVAKGIRTGDFEMASREKSRVENEQRQRRRDELAEGAKWEWRHFDRVESDPVCEFFFGFCLRKWEMIVLLIVCPGCFVDEELGKLFKAQPPTEDAYIFRSNGPHD